MDNKVGQPESDWRTQIEQLSAIKNLWGKKKKQAIEMVIHYLGFSTELTDVLRDVEYRVDANFGRMGRGVYQQAFVKVEQPLLYEEGKENSIQTFEEDSVYQTIWTPEQGIRQEIMAEIKALYDKGYLQRLKSADKTGIIDAIFIKKVGEKKIRGGKDQIDYASDLYVTEWERIYRQATKIAQMQGISVIPFLDIDKHFCKMFDVKKAQEIRPRFDKVLLNDAWKGSITASICMMKRLLASDQKKKQADYLSLTLFYTIISSQCDEKIRDEVYSTIQQFIKKKKIKEEKIRIPGHMSTRRVKDILNKKIPFYLNSLKESKVTSLPRMDAEDMEQLKIAIFNQISGYCVIDRKKFIQIYGIPEKTFYRRQQEYLTFKKDLQQGLKMADKEYLDALQLGESFGLLYQPPAT